MFALKAHPSNLGTKRVGKQWVLGTNSQMGMASFFEPMLSKKDVEIGIGLRNERKVGL